MSMTINTLLSDISGVVHGTTTNKIPNIYGIINRAARAVLLDIDPKETQRIVELPQVFNNVFDYTLPSDVKGDRIIDIRPQAGRNPSDIFAQGYATSFDSTKLLNTANKIYTQWNTGVKTIRIEAPTLTAPTTISDTSTLTGWTSAGGVGTITLDTTNNVSGGGALVFPLATGQASGQLINSTLSQIDLSGLYGTGTLFTYVYLPVATNFTSVTLQWGVDSSNYYYYTATSTQQGTSFQNGWNLLAFPWVSAIKVGTPSSTAKSYGYTSAIFNYNSTAQNGVKLDNISIAPGYIFEIQYYSKFLFRDPATNAFQETIVDALDNNKIINLDTESYNLLFNKTAFFVAQSLQGADAQYDADYWQTEYENSLKRYKGMNPSEAMNKGETYYKMPKKGYSRYGANFFRG